MSQSVLSYGLPVHATDTHATAPTATITGVAGQTIFVSNVSCSSDKAGSILLIKDGSTTIWQEQVGAGFCNLSFSPPLSCTVGASAVATIDSTSAGKANINGVMAGAP